MLKYLGKMVLAAAVLAAAVMYLYGKDIGTLLSSKDRFSSSQIPLCNDSIVIKTSKEAAEQGPLGLSNYRILDLTDIRQIDQESNDSKRTCLATVFTSVGKLELKYTVEWIDESNGRFYVLDLSTNPIGTQKAMEDLMEMKNHPEIQAEIQRQADIKEALRQKELIDKFRNFGHHDN